MVRHHVKKKRSKKTLKEDKNKVKRKREEENLDRFAGSSEEDDDDVVEDEEIASPTDRMISNKKKKVESFSTDEESLGEQMKEEKDSRSVSSSSDDDDDDDEYGVGSTANGPMFLSGNEGESSQQMLPQSGMAGAMSRILGLSTSNNNKKNSDNQNIVLSKTKTPLQKLQLKEKEERLQAKEQRKERRSERLTCMHIPLLAATTFQMNNSTKSMTQELELERMHRRVATRGVVALFNAIAQHQQNQTTQELQVVSFFQQQRNYSSLMFYFVVKFWQ